MWALGALVVFVTLAIVALPFVASTQIVRDRIAGELGIWSGYRVTLGGAPEIEVWPNFRAILSDVRFSDWSDPDQKPVLAAERMQLDLAAFSAVRGKIVFNNARLVRPTLRVTTTGKPLPLPAAPDGGRMLRSVEIARAVVATNPTAPDLNALPDDTLGRIEFNDGRVLLTGADGDTEIVTGLTGSLDWAALNRPAVIAATAIWHGESVKVEASATKPLLLLGGGASPLSVKIAAAPASLSFDGMASAGGDAYLEGPFSFSSPSVRRTLEWSHRESMPDAAIGSIAVTSRISGDMKRLKFDDVEITLDGNPGMGALEASLANGVPGISGTLAFENLDLRSFLSAFTPLESSGAKEIDTTFTDQLSLDLRLSAARATAGRVSLANVAATAQVKSGLAAFDISDATAFGGTVQASLRFDRKPDAENVEIRLLASDVEGMALGKAIGIAALPAARGTVSLTMKGQGKTWNGFLGTATGSFAASFGAGNLAKVDLRAFIERTKQGGFFALTEVAGNSLAIDGIEIKANIDDGIAWIDKAEARSGDVTIRLKGIVPYLSGGLALSGSVLTATQKTDPTAPPDSAFFVGGSWNAPFVSPVFRELPPE